MKKIDCKNLGDMCEFMLDGEPVFIIRAHDAAAVGALVEYKELSKLAGGGNLIRTQASIDRFESWQKAHKDFVRPAD